MTAPIIYHPSGLPARQMAAQRAYISGQIDGANQRFRPRTRSADADIRKAIGIIVGRCRDQAQNNPSIQGAIRRISNNAVRDGITPQFQFRQASGRLDTAGNGRWEDIFWRWGRYADIAGDKSVWKMQRLTLEHMWFDGEVLIHRVYDDSIPGLPPLRLEMLERDHFDSAVDGLLTNGNVARQGKEFDARGRCVAYHLFPTHPGDARYQTPVRAKSVRIPASEIIDVWDAVRISQTCGVPWLAAVVMEAFDLEDYRAYERIGAKLAAAFGIFIKSNFPDIGAPGLGVQPGTQDQAATWPTNWSNMPDYIDPGRIQSIPYGTDLVIASHNRPGTQYDPYVKESRRTQSTGLGMSYEAYSNDYTAASYSSARAGSLEERLSYQGMQTFLDEKLNQKLFAWFIESAWLAGLNPTPMPDFHLNPWPYLEAVLPQPPGWSWVDPLKDGQASQLKIAEAMSCRRRESAGQGVDWDDNLGEVTEEESRLTPLVVSRAINTAIANLGSQMTFDNAAATIALIEQLAARGMTDVKSRI